MPDSSSTAPPDGVNWTTRLAALGALALSLIVLLVIVVGSVGGGDTETGAPVAGEQSSQEDSGDKDGPVNPKEYAVEEGDTLSSIAEKFDVSVKRLERLNPDVDSQALSTGQELKIR